MADDGQSLRHLTAFRTVRLRLTLVYGALFAVSGAVLLAITYLLVRSSRARTLFVQGEGPHSDLRTFAAHQQEAILENLLLQSVIALALMSVISFVLG
jgi:hypothetical protein